MEKTMKKAGMMLCLALLCAGAAVAQTAKSKDGYIEVNGYNKTEVEPDRIYISFQIDEKDDKGKTSLAQREKDMLRALERAGIDLDKQLTINDMSSNFQKYVFRRQDIFQSRDYQVVVPNAQQAAAVFAALQGVGISNANITRMDRSDIDKLRLESKVLAIKAAKEKATVLAEAIGQSIGKATMIQDFERPMVVNYSLMRAKASYDTAEAAPVAGAGPAIEFDKIKIESSITVRFVLNR